MSEDIKDLNEQEAVNAEEFSPSEKDYTEVYSGTNNDGPQPQESPVTTPRSMPAPAVARANCDTDNVGINVYPTVEEAQQTKLDATKKWTNESNLTLNSFVRVTCIDKISGGSFIKNLTCKEIITGMIRRKIGNVKFINDARAKSFVALVRDLDKSTYGSNISLNQKAMIIRYAIEGQGLKLEDN